jgi:excisionase family DNA binding protein
MISPFIVFFLIISMLLVCAGSAWHVNHDMSSNFVVNRICESCGEVFQAKTTVTRFCSSKCNKRASKQKLRGVKMASMDDMISKLTAKHSDDISSREFLSVKMAARLLGASDKIIYGMIKSGKIRGVNLSQRKTVIYRHDIDNLFILPEPLSPQEEEITFDNSYNMAQAQRVFNISEKALYDIIKRHSVTKKRIGKGVYVLKKSLEVIFNT